jgi:hypothetical protein
MNCKYYIGIDCGTKTGLCVYNAEEKMITVLATYQIHEAMRITEDWCKSWPGQVMVRVEDARQRKWIPRQKTESAERGRREGAGSVKRDAAIWEGLLKSLGAKYEMVPPKNNKTKVTADYFKKLTGYQERTNEHCRDAAMLVVGF